MDAKYTAEMEDKLDAISEGNSSRHDLLTSFYSDFSTCMDKAEKIWRSFLMLRQARNALTVERI